MDTMEVFAEEPEEEQWRMLLQYSYDANIRRYLDEHHITPAADADELVNAIAGALVQADEYYKASRLVTLQVQPLLLYYGTTNMLYAMHALTTGSIPEISNHGAHIPKGIDPTTALAETRVTFDHPSDGGIHIFTQSLGYDIELWNCRGWTLGDFLDSIAEIKQDFEACYTDRASRVLMLQTVETPEGMVERVVIERGSAKDAILSVEGIDSAYLPPQRGQTQQGEPCLLLRHKMNGPGISKTAHSGQPYLQVAKQMGSSTITVPSEICMYIALFVLGMLCRYHPEVWNPFVTKDASGERLLVEKLLYYARRTLPNVVLDRIQGKHTVFVSSRYRPESRVQLVGEHDVREIVEREVSLQLKSDLARRIVRDSRG